MGVPQESEALGLKTNIALIGFMGTGKTTVGLTLAKMLHKEFLDTDEEIEKATGLKIEEIFTRYGEIRFRSEESLAIKKAAGKQGCVIATGGGAVLRPENLEYLRASSYIICLQTEPEVIQTRVSRRIRPLLRKDRSVQHIGALLQERQAYYQGADLYVNTSELNHEEVALEIIVWLKDKAASGN